jgi:NTE family protein
MMGQADDTLSAGHQSVGLVLSGGGAKGIAHIGVIQALEDNNIPIDYIAGTSMGAIVGGLYAAGYTPAEMMQLIESRAFGYWSTGKVDPRLNFFFNRETPSPAMMTVPIGASRDSVAASLISPLPMDFAFMELFSAYTAQCGGNFDNLFVPFRCVASNVEQKRKEVLRGGSLGDAIRASMSFPVVFQPTIIDSVLLYDGGIYDNFPIDVMRRDFAPSIMIGVSVNTPTGKPQTSLVDQVENLIVQNTDYNLPADEGIKLHIKLTEFGLLDFAKARQIYQIGYDRAMAMMDSIKQRIPTRVSPTTRRFKRRVFKSQSPYLTFNQVTATGGTLQQNHYLEYLFSTHNSDTLGICRARDAYYRAVSSGKLRELHPEAVYNDSTGMFALNLRASVKDNYRVGFGGYLTSSNNSYIYVSAGYSTLSFNSMSADFGAWVGQSYYAAMLNARIHLRTICPSALAFEGVLSRQKYYESDHLFYEDKVPSFVVGNEYFGRLKLSFAARRSSVAELGIGGGRLSNSFFPNDYKTDYKYGRDKMAHNLVNAFARYLSSTLDNLNYPTSGAYYQATAMAVIGNFNYHPANNVTQDDRRNVKWLQLESRTRNYLSLSSHWGLGLESDVMLSTRKLLPSYDASIISAPEFAPTPASNNSFSAELRANSFIAAGIVPIYTVMENLTCRIGGYAFMPIRRIIEEPDTKLARYGDWFGSVKFFGEADVTYQFPFGTLGAYCNYLDSKTSRWNVGISFGIYLTAPKMLR